MANGEWSAQKQNKVGFRLAARLVDTAIRNAERNPRDQGAQQLANEMSDALTAFRREEAAGS